MKHHTQIYPRNSSQWWCGGYQVGPACAKPAEFECLHETATAAEICERNPTRYRSPAAINEIDTKLHQRAPVTEADDMVKAYEDAQGAGARLDAAMRGAMKDICEPVTEAPLPEIVEMLMGCERCPQPTRCAIGDCLKAALAVRIVTDRLRHQRG